MREGTEKKGGIKAKPTQERPEAPSPQKPASAIENKVRELLSLQKSGGEQKKKDFGSSNPKSLSIAGVELIDGKMWLKIIRRK